MASIPTEAEIKIIQEAAQNAIKEKQKLQKLEGKDFVHDIYGPGVVPEEHWQELKDIAKEIT